MIHISLSFFVQWVIYVTILSPPVYDGGKLLDAIEIKQILEKF